MRPALLMALAVAFLVGCGEPGAPAEPASEMVAQVAAIRATAQRQATALTVAPTATPSPRPTSTASPMPTPTVSPTPTATPSPTVTPAPQAIRLTEGGCCTQPFWSSEGTEVQFIDRPSGDTRLGVWGAPVAQPGTAPRFVTERLEESLGAGGFLIETDSNTTTIERLSDGTRWTVPARGRSVRISPGATRIAWTEGNDELPPDQQVTAFWVANLDGSEPRKVATLRRGGLSGWISEDVLLVSGRERAGAPEQVLWALPLDGSPRTELARAERLRGPLLSPSGSWVTYYVTFDADPARNGLWVVRTDGNARRQLPPELFGSYQWRGCAEACDPEDEALLIVPLQPEARYHELWQVQAATGDAQRLTDPAVTPFKIANGDWRVSPDGRHVAYVESSDRNIWVLELPE